MTCIGVADVPLRAGCWTVSSSTSVVSASFTAAERPAYHCKLRFYIRKQALNNQGEMLHLPLERSSAMLTKSSKGLLVATTSPGSGKSHIHVAALLRRFLGGSWSLGEEPMLGLGL